MDPSDNLQSRYDQLLEEVQYLRQKVREFESSPDAQVQALTGALGAYDIQVEELRAKIRYLLDEEEKEIIWSANRFVSMSNANRNLKINLIQLQAENEGLKSQITSLNDRIDRLEKANAGLTREVGELKAVNAGLIREVGELKAVNAGLTREVGELKAVNAGLTKSNIGLTQDIEDLKAKNIHDEEERIWSNTISDMFYIYMRRIEVELIDAIRTEFKDPYKIINAYNKFKGLTGADKVKYEDYKNFKKAEPIFLQIVADDLRVPVKMDDFCPTNDIRVKRNCAGHTLDTGIQNGQNLPKLERLKPKVPSNDIFLTALVNKLIVINS